MGCCGDKRTRLYQASNVPAETNTSVYFQYTGKTGMTVIGRETRRRYRFDRPGAVAAVDARDKTALVFVPNLRLVDERSIP